MNSNWLIEWLVSSPIVSFGISLLSFVLAIFVGWFRLTGDTDRNYFPRLGSLGLELSRIRAAGWVCLAFGVLLQLASLWVQFMADAEADNKIDAITNVTSESKSQLDSAIAALEKSQRALDELKTAANDQLLVSAAQLQAIDHANERMKSTLQMMLSFHLVQTNSEVEDLANAQIVDSQGALASQSAAGLDHLFMLAAVGRITDNNLKTSALPIMEGCEVSMAKSLPTFKANPKSDKETVSRMEKCHKELIDTIAIYKSKSPANTGDLLSHLERATMVIRAYDSNSHWLRKHHKITRLDEYITAMEEIQKNSFRPTMPAKPAATGGN